MTEKLKSIEEIKAELAGRAMSASAKAKENVSSNKANPVMVEKKNEKPVETVKAETKIDKEENRGASAGIAMEQLLKETLTKNVATLTKEKNEEIKFGETPTIIKKLGSKLTSLIKSILFIVVGSPIIAVIGLIKDIIKYK